MKKEEKIKPKILLTSIAQEYGLTLEDVLKELGVSKENVIIEDKTIDILEKKED